MTRHDRSSKYDAAGWALFFIWVGVAWLGELSIAKGLLGVAVITLGMQALLLWKVWPGSRHKDES